jgi:hypothetical protein
MALEQFRAIERLRKRFAYSVIEKEFELFRYCTSRFGYTQNSCRAESAHLR